MHITFAVLVDKRELGRVMLVSIDIKIEYSNFTADTDCMLLLLFLFKANYLFFVYLLIKRYGFVTINF